MRERAGAGSRPQQRWAFRFRAMRPTILAWTMLALSIVSWYSHLRTQYYTTQRGGARVSTTQTLTAVPVGTWRLDPVHSSVGFEVDYMAGTFKGAFRDVEAKLDVEDSGSHLEGAAKVASVDVKDENLATHLQSPDFFDAEQHPELHFTATDIALDG